MPTNNHITVDFGKIQFAHLRYRNQYGDVRRVKPKFSVHNTEYEPTTRMYNSTETALEFAKRRNLIDIWTPECRMQLSANHTLVYTGKKARAMWKAWNERIFKCPKK